MSSSCSSSARMDRLISSPVLGQVYGKNSIMTKYHFYSPAQKMYLVGEKMREEEVFLVCEITDQ